MLLRIDHETRLSYASPVTDAVFEVRTAPSTSDDQSVLGYKLRVTPPSPVTSYRDGYGNKVELFNLLAPHTEVLVRSSCCVRMTRSPADARLAQVPFDPSAPVDLPAMEFVRPSPLADLTPGVRELADGVPVDGAKSVREAAELVMAVVRAKLGYEKTVTQAHTKASEALGMGRGVCQDFAHLFLAVARHRGLPCRYVSGYINIPGEIATHAWVQVWGGAAVGGADIDPTHACWCGSDHVVTAVGRDFADVPPNRGVFKGDAEEMLSATVSVRTVDRVPADLTEPADAPAWTNLVAAQSTAGRNTWLNQQTRRTAFRQQQSQQQQ